MVGKILVKYKQISKSISATSRNPDICVESFPMALKIWHFAGISALFSAVAEVSTKFPGNIRIQDLIASFRPCRILGWSEIPLGLLSSWGLHHKLHIAQLHIVMVRQHRIIRNNSMVPFIPCNVLQHNYDMPQSCDGCAVDASARVKLSWKRFCP